MSKPSACEGVEDATHQLTAETGRWLRYHPQWSGDIKLSAGIQRGAFISTEITVRMVQHPRTKNIPEDADIAATNEAAMRLVRQRMRLQAEAAFRYNSALYGSLCAVCYFRRGLLVRSDVYVSDTQLATVQKL